MLARVSDEKQSPATEKTEPKTDPAKAESPPPKEGRLGGFIQKYHTFMSTFVIGAAGLIATSIWQYRQSEIARHQAESQQTIAATQADNSWRIERAEILSKNLSVLSASGENNVEQRYGVLLSLTRGNILDPELAVSYALELGKDNPDYMKSVLANTSDKSYARLASAFELTCTQKYGLARDVPLCKNDKLAERSAAISELISDEIELARLHDKPGPETLLADERVVQSMPARLAWLFTPYLNSLYERRLWNEIARFEAVSPGTRLISSLVLGPARPSEFVAASELGDVDKFHEERVRWLLGYLFLNSCNAECKAKLVDVMLTQGEAHGRFDEALRNLLERPRAEVTSVMSRLHTRLLACQIENDDLLRFRDHVVVPALLDESKKPQPDLSRLDDLLGLLALMPAPPVAAKDDVAAQTLRNLWSAALKQARDVMKDQFQRAYVNRVQAAQATRTAPPVALKRVLFCSAAESSSEAVDLGED